MGQSSGIKNRLKGIVKWLFITAGIIYVLTLVLSKALPPLVRSVIISKASEAGLQVGKLTIRDIGLTNIELREVEIGDPMKPALSIASMSIDYSTHALLGGTVEKIVISGAKIHPEALDRLPKGEPQKAAQPNFAVNHLQLLSSEVDVALPNGRITFPLEADLRRAEDSHRYKIAVRASPFGESWTCEGTIDADSGDGQLIVKAEKFRLQRWTDVLMRDSRFILPSPAEATIDVELSQWSLEHADITGNATLFDVVLPPYSIRASWSFRVAIPSSLQPEDLDANINFHTITGPEFEIIRPFTIKISGESLNRLTAKTQNISISKPLPLAIREINSLISATQGSAEFKGSYTAELPPDSLNLIQPSLRADGPVTATGDLAFTLPSSESPWRMSGTIRQPLTLGGDQIKTTLDRLAVGYALDGDQEKIESRVLLDAHGLQMTLKDLSLSGKRIHMKGTIVTSSAGWRSSGDLRLEGLDAGIGEQITIENLSAVIPFQSRLTPKNRITQSGTFNADVVDIAGLLLKKMEGELGVGPGVTQAVGQAELPVEPLIIKYNGEHKTTSGLDSYSLNFEIPSTQLPPKTSLAPFHSLLEGIDASGTIACAGRIEGAGEMFTGAGELRLKDFQISMSESRISMVGIDGILRFRDLIAFLSEPAQELTIRELNVQGIPFHDGRLIFTSEGRGSVLVERGQFGLLGGKVFFGGVRAGGDKTVIDTVLYCDRIDFDRLLNVLVGETIASGDAEINGVLPITLIDGSPLFRKGFLYSSPGIQGTLQIQDASLISGGMVLVEEAVRDFNYQWVRVTLNSNNNRLDMNVILKGVPAAKLPLEYDGKKKDFVRSKTGKRMVDLKGLTLELKFLDIDLQRLLKEGGKVMVMTDKKQKGEHR